MKVIKLKSDNYNGYVTQEAYQEIRLQMSSGDFGSHSATLVDFEDVPESEKDTIVLLTDVLEETA